VKDLIGDSDIIVYNLEDSLSEALEAIYYLQQYSGDKVKTFVGISNIFTWGNSHAGLVGTEGEEKPSLQEGNYVRRKPWGEYIPYKTVETQILSISSTRVKTLVVGSGVTYGGGEACFENLFREAWMCNGKSISIPTLKGGGNFIPTIHVKDLGSIVARVATNLPEDKQYILALDKSKVTLNDIATAVAKTLSYGQVAPTPPEHFYRIQNDTNVQRMQVDLHFSLDSTHVSTLEDIPWVSEGGIVENIDNIVSEYKRIRNLRPVRGLLLGPPGSGKSYFANKISSMYYLPIVTVKSAVEEVKLMEEERDLAAEIQEALTSSETARLPARLLGKIFRKVLSSPDKRNKGWYGFIFHAVSKYQVNTHIQHATCDFLRVLDGYPRTYEEAKFVFADRGEDDSGEPSDEAGELDMTIDSKFKPSVVSRNPFPSLVYTYMMMIVTLTPESLFPFFHTNQSQGVILHLV
jgi:adenylate kinase